MLCTVLNSFGPGFFGSFGGLPQSLMKLSFGVVLGDARAAVAVGDEVGAVGQPRDVRRPIERVRSAAAHAELSLAVHQLPVVGEAVDHVQLVVDDPDVLLLVVRADLDLMRSAAAGQLREHLVEMRPLVDEVALAVHDDRSSARTGAPIRASLPARTSRRCRRRCRWRCRATD